MAGLLKNQSLIDTGFLFAVLDESDEKHQACSMIFANEQNVLLPEVVLPELAYLVIRSLGYKVFFDLIDYLLDRQIPLISMTSTDLERVKEILEQYEDGKLDFVDAAIMAIAERLEIERILTVDRRDFGIFRPRHCAAFEIVP